MKGLGTQIDEIRKQWGKRLLILGHHYQRLSVLRHTDERGDSLELSRKAAAHTEAERIVFCGVRFMAESADILTRQDQVVYMPEPSAGCPMANMATVVDMESAWKLLTATAGPDWLPIVYVNSSAEVKACCGRHGGTTCTSSNAARAFQWAFSAKKRVFFLPDEHLGANTAHDYGIPDEEVAVYNPKIEAGGLSPDVMKRAKVIVWKGFCIVHTAFTVAHVKAVREMLPGAKIIVHPETPKDVVRLADAHGSTSQIIKYVEAAPDGSTIVIGTEANLIDRLAQEQAGRVTIKALSPSVCANMARTNERNLMEVLRDWPEANRVSVPSDVADDARKALERMLQI
ncbi:MAG: quinolinate synthase [Verrucomicrobia bacterium]|nr:quinolinate synthase [Verrucomicrobiota bacterium]